MPPVRKYAGPRRQGERSAKVTQKDKKFMPPKKTYKKEHKKVIDQDKTFLCLRRLSLMNNEYL